MMLLSKSSDIEPLPLILPGSLEYLLASEEIGLFPGAMDFVNRSGNEGAFISRPESGGLLEWVTWAEYEEFVEDGEYALRQAELESEWADDEGEAYLI